MSKEREVDASLPREAPPGVAIYVVMGVASSGKTTIGRALARMLGWDFRDADSFHPAENVAKMSRGEPLDDADREPWLAAIAAWIDGQRQAGGHGVVTCSALKRRYRSVIVGERADVRLVYLRGTRALIGRRIARRRHHFMPASLLDSQFDALEEPGPDENPIIVAVSARPRAILTRILAS
jgi:carbohydrate kinase (thermoresistant glucokinase family)